MDRESNPPGTREHPRFGGFTPDEAAEEELRWYFNESAIDLYTERRWPERLERMFGELAGPITGSAAVWDEYARDEDRFHTGTESVEEWIEMLLAEGCGERIEPWRRAAEHRCAAAIAAYEPVRGWGPSVVPDGCAREKEQE